jgi:hypothetical protein
MIELVFGNFVLEQQFLERLLFPTFVRMVFQGQRSKLRLEVPQLLDGLKLEIRIAIHRRYLKNKLVREQTQAHTHTQTPNIQVHVYTCTNATTGTAHKHRHTHIHD